jgi:hypothetical protein
LTHVIPDDCIHDFGSSSKLDFGLDLLELASLNASEVGSVFQDSGDALWSANSCVDDIRGSVAESTLGKTLPFP